MKPIKSTATITVILYIDDSVEARVKGEGQAQEIANHMMRIAGAAQGANYLGTHEEEEQ